MCLRIPLNDPCVDVMSVCCFNRITCLLFIHWCRWHHHICRNYPYVDHIYIQCIYIFVGSNFWPKIHRGVSSFILRLNWPPRAHWCPPTTDRLTWWVIIDCHVDQQPVIGAIHRSMSNLGLSYDLNTDKCLKYYKRNWQYIQWLSQELVWINFISHSWDISSLCDILSHFHEILSHFHKKYHFHKTISRFCEILSLFCEILYCFHKIMLTFREILSHYPEILSHFREILSRFREIIFIKCRVHWARYGQIRSIKGTLKYDQIWVDHAELWLWLCHIFMWIGSTNEHIELPRAYSNILQLDLITLWITK